MSRSPAAGLAAPPMLANSASSLASGSLHAQPAPGDSEVSRGAWVWSAVTFATVGDNQPRIGSRDDLQGEQVPTTSPTPALCYVRSSRRRTAGRGRSGSAASAAGRAVLAVRAGDGQPGLRPVPRAPGLDPVPAGRLPPLARHQLVLDLTRPEVARSVASAHVSAPSSHQTRALQPFSLRCATALFGQLSGWSGTSPGRPDARAELAADRAVQAAPRAASLRWCAASTAPTRGMHGVVAADGSAALSCVQLEPPPHAWPARSGSAASTRPAAPNHRRDAGRAGAPQPRWFGPGALDGVPGGFGDVLAPGRDGPAEGAVGKLIDVPPGVLLEPVVVPALRTPITQTGSAARFVRDVVLEVCTGWRACRQTGLVQVAYRTWDRCRSLTPGSWPRAWNR